VFIAEGLEPWPHHDALVEDLLRREVPFSTKGPGDFIRFTGRFAAHWESDA